MLNLTVPLCIRIVQRRTATEAAIAMMLLSLTVFLTAVLAAHLHRGLTSQVTAISGRTARIVALFWRRL